MLFLIPQKSLNNVNCLAIILLQILQNIRALPKQKQRFMFMYERKKKVDKKWCANITLANV